jgi:Ku70/Ku80-like protein
MRPHWKGYLKLALVSCPIALHAACSRTERIRFRQINKKTGNQLRQQLIDEETGEPVDREHSALRRCAILLRRLGSSAVTAVTDVSIDFGLSGDEALPPRTRSDRRFGEPASDVRADRFGPWSDSIASDHGPACS